MSIRTLSSLLPSYLWKVLQQALFRQRQTPILILVCLGYLSVSSYKQVIEELIRDERDHSETYIATWYAAMLATFPLTVPGLDVRDGVVVSFSSDVLVSGDLQELMASISASHSSLSHATVLYLMCGMAWILETRV
ncbi:hypothetical protein Pdw03_0943 [Penicillium digitatum]|uniref:Uncharacterized protein n=1 Tax=Penicillium digitatum TaxID=36651 RepID=A0A7T6XRR1_PENDI|nr:hypothetical protein PDIDSM_7377 [Penicillium digitatum]QQK46045.1 hypothetical protein Pdw03_0943 [Penicillium digitatum]